MEKKNYKKLDNEALARLLFEEEDRLSIEAVDEIIRRSDEFLPVLSDITMDRSLWIADLPQWWVTVHSTYILGKIGGPETVIPLMSALRWSDAYDNEWITEDLPSILGSLGETSWLSVLQVVKDRSAGWSARSIAMDALGSQALNRPNVEEEAMEMLGRVLKNEAEELGARRSAAFVLLDFRRSDYKKELMSFAKQEKRIQQQFADYMVAFSVQDVENDLTAPRIAMDFYMRDWMTFYEAGEIKARQKKWKEEDLQMKEDLLSQNINWGRRATMISREEACPCGSGKSYKRCCFKKLH